MLNKIKQNSYDVHSKLTEAVDLKKIVPKCLICNTQNSDTTLWRASNFMTSDPLSLHNYFIKSAALLSASTLQWNRWLDLLGSAHESSIPV